MFNKNSWLLGFLLGIVIPVLVYFLIITVLWLVGKTNGLEYQNQPQAPALAGMAINVLLFRYYMVNRKADKTGSALIAVTFLLTIGIFLFF